MSNAKVLNCSTIRQPPTHYSLRQSNQQSSIRGKMMLVETTSTAATSRVKEMKKLNANNLSPLNSPQLIRSTRVAESNGWANSVKVKSSCSSGSNSVESIVPKYQIATNASILSQKRSYLNQTSTVNKLTNKTMNMRNDKCKKEVSESIAIQKTIMNGGSVKKTVSTATAKKLLKSTYPAASPTKSFSSKFPNGLPFENEFYHYRKNNRRSSVASDSTTSNNSSDEFNHQRLSNSPYQDEFRRNPSNDALYVDFTLKTFDNFNTDDDKKAKKVTKASALTTKTKYILTDKNCFCEFESVKSSASSTNSSNSGQQQVDFITATKSRANKDVVYVTSASIFPKCNRAETKNENAVKNE
jgi:hypothetical protein